MPIEFRDAARGSLQPFSAIVPDRSIIGVVGLKGSGKSALLELAADRENARLIRPGDALNLSAVSVLCIDGALDGFDPLVKQRAAVGIERSMRNRTIVFLVSHDEALLFRLADEIWWLDGGSIRARGDPRKVLDQYLESVAAQLVAWGKTLSEPLDLSTRRGDALAEITSIETLDAAGATSGVLRSGNEASIRVTVRFRDAVDDPVIGIMIRTRVGFDVFGTNTELEGLALGPQHPGAELRLNFAFSCELCPGDYTVTAACHDPDGTSHDWLDDAIAFSVVDSRYTAGVANLRARVSLV